MGYQNIEYRKEKNIGILAVNRPKALNALNTETIQEMRSVFNEVKMDDDLEQLVNQAKRIINGVDPDDLRNDHVFRNRISEQMNAVKQEIDQSIEDMPRRKLRLAA